MENRLLPEIYKHNPTSLKYLNESLWDLKAMSFNSLYHTQNILSGIERINIDMANFVMMSEDRYGINLNLSFIPKDKRGKYRNSPFYKKEIPTNDIISNPDVFNQMMIIFINGEFYDNFLITCNEDFTTLLCRVYSSFPVKPPAHYMRGGFTNAEMLNYIKTHAKMTLLLMPISQQKTRTDMNIATIKNYMNLPNSTGIAIDTNFISMNDIDDTSDLLMFLSSDDLRLYKYQPMLGEYKNKSFYFDKTQLNTFTNIRAYMKPFFLLNLFKKITIPSSEVFFQVDIQDMPVPTENMIIFRKSPTGVLKFDHETTIDINYPNIYQINRKHTDELLVYVFYFDDTLSVGTKYDNDLALYHRFTTNILEKYKDDTIPEIIRNYSPVKVNYDHTDLIQSTEYPSHLKYKLRTFTDLVKENGKNYLDYLYKVVGYVPNFYLYPKDMNLSSRIRLDNKKEITDPSLQETFDEPMYLFTFRHDSNKDHLIMFIDNYFYYPNKMFVTEKYKFIYVPTSMIDEDSIIEIEKLLDSSYKQEITFDGINRFVFLKMPTGQNIKLSDVFVTKIIEGVEVYVDETSYEFYEKLDNLYHLVPHTFAISSDSIFIKPKNESILNLPLVVRAENNNIIRANVGDNYFAINGILNNDKSKVRMFKNGQMVPRSTTISNFNSLNASGPHTFRCLTEIKPTDEFVLVISNNKYSLVYEQKLIGKDGYINMTGEISKPIDRKWYDIFINGLKLNERNIDILTPYRFMMTNINTLKNFEVYLKNLDVGQNIPDWSDDISDKILDTVGGLIEEVLDQYPELEDELPDIKIDIVLDYIGFFEDYINFIGLINPDIDQISDEMINQYKDIFEDGPDMFLNSDLTIVMEKPFMVNPDNKGLTYNTQETVGY